jgi:hypothetical protein
MLLTSHMGVAMASGMSKNGSLSDPDAVTPVVKRKCPIYEYFHPY